MSDLELIEKENFGAVECDFFKNKENEIYMTISQLAKALGYSSKNAIDNMLRRNEYLQDGEFSTTYSLLVVEGNREVTRERVVFTEDGVYEVTMLSTKPKAREFRCWARQVIKEIRKTGSYSVEQYNNDINEFDVLRGMVDKLEEVSNKVEEVENNQEVLEKRLDNLDNVDINGSLKDTLNAMVRKYALDKGKKFGVAWGEFYRNYNRAYSTNLKLRITNHKKRTGSKLTAPQLLEKDGELKDAIRVIDKMLN